MTFVDKWLVGDERKEWFVWFFYFALLIGTWKILWWILTPLMICCKHKCRGRQDLRKKYGRIDNSAYAVVTGGSDGIGLELCH